MLDRPVPRTRWLVPSLVLVTLAFGCATPPARVATQPAHAAPFDADGIFTRFHRLRLAPSHTKGFESLLKRCVAAAEAASLPESHEWLCYRESPGRYWIVTFSPTIDGFVHPPSLAGFVAFVAGSEGEAARDDVMAMLHQLEVESEAWMLTRQKAEWSTVRTMSTSSNPKARVMLRTVRRGMDEAFDAALTRRTAFFREHGYPLPIEGFVTIDAEPVALRRAQMQVVFPVDWPSFHATESFYAFVSALDGASQAHYATRKAALMETMSRAEFFDGGHAPELRYDAAR